MPLNKDPASLIKNQLKIRQLRNRAPKDDALTPEETMALNAIIAQVSQKSATPAESKRALEEAANEYGKKAFLDFFAEKPLINGVPYTWFVAIAVTCLGLFIITQNFMILLIAAPVLHILCALYYRSIRTRVRREAISKIIAGETLFS